MKFFQDLKQEALQTKLSQNEKQAMRMALYNEIKKTPYTVVEEVRVVRSVRSSYVWFSPQFALPVAVFLIIGLGTGTAYASQTALPGDALYSIKVNVTEPAVGALAIGDEAKAQWHADVAQTRLEEAESLAASGKLDATTSAQLVQNFDEHSIQAAALAQKVEDEDPGSGAELAAQFDSTLAAHDAILARVGDTSSTSKQFADDVAQHVRERGSVILALVTTGSNDTLAETESNDSSGGEGAPVAMTMSVQTFAAVAPDTATTSGDVSANAKIQAPAASAKVVVAPTQAQIKAITKLKKSAASALADAKEAYDSVKNSLDASTTIKIQGEFARISANVDAATSTASLIGALKDATVLEAFLKASKNLKQNFFSDDKNSHNSHLQHTSASNDGSATSTPDNSASVTSDTQTQVQASGDGGGSSSSNDGGGQQEEHTSSQSGDDSFVRSLLKSF